MSHPTPPVAQILTSPRLYATLAAPLDAGGPFFTGPR